MLHDTDEVLEMDALDLNLKRKQDEISTRAEANESRKKRKLEADEKEVGKSRKAMTDMALFNAGSYLQTNGAREKLINEYGLSKKWNIDEKESGDDWVVYKRKTHEDGKPDNVIAFRGSAKLRDWLTNTTIATDRFPKSPRYVRTKKEFKRIMNDLEGSKMVTGHSLGGLIALSLGRDFSVPSVTFNRAAAWDQLKSNLGQVKSINYTTNTQGGATDFVSLASYWAPSKGETVIPINVKEGNESLLGAHGLDNFLPPEKTQGFNDTLVKEDVGNKIKSVTKTLFEIGQEVGVGEKIKKALGLDGDITWKVVLGYGVDKTVEEMLKRGAISPELAAQLKQVRVFAENPKEFIGKRLTNFLKTHLGDAKEWAEGKVKGAWESIKDKMPSGDNYDEWEPEEGWWESGEIVDDNPAYQEDNFYPDDDNWEIDEEIDWDGEGGPKQKAPAPDPLEGFEEPETFIDDPDVSGAWEDEHEAALPDEDFAIDEPDIPEFPELEEIGGSDELAGIGIGAGEGAETAAIEEGFGTAVMEGLQTGNEFMAAAGAVGIPLYYLYKSEKQDEYVANQKRYTREARNNKIAELAFGLGLDPDKQIDGYVKKFPALESALRPMKESSIGGMNPYEYDYDAFYGQGTLEYLSWRSKNQDVTKGGISAQEGLDLIRRTNLTGKTDELADIKQRHQMEDDRVSGDRYDIASQTTNLDAQGRTPLELADIANDKKNFSMLEHVFRKSVDRTVTGQVTWDDHEKVHWRKEGEIGIPQRDGTIKWTQRNELPRNTFKKSPGATDTWKWNHQSKSYVHNTDRGGMSGYRPGRFDKVFFQEDDNRVGISRANEKYTHGDGDVHIDRNSFAGKGRQHPTLSGTNDKGTHDKVSTKNDRFDKESGAKKAAHQSTSSQGQGKGIKEKNKELHPPIAVGGSALDPKTHHPLDPLQPHGAVHADATHNAPGNPEKTPAHQVAPGENHNPFSGHTGSSEHTFGVQGTGGITMRQLHQRSSLQNIANQQLLGQAADVNFMRALNAREGRW